MSPPPADPLRAVARCAGERPAWLVGGAVRDRLLGREAGPIADYDVIVDGDPGPLARAAGREAGGHAFALSEAFGAWRVVARDRRWQLDLLGLGGATLEQDLARRDLTVNAIAQPLGAGAGAGAGELVDPFGGVGDVRARRLRMVSATAFAADPLRVMRLARLAAELGFAAEPATVSRAGASAGDLAGVAPERVFAELRALLVGDGALAGLETLDVLGATDVVLPELAALRGVGQSRYHHRDVLGHTREVLAETIALVKDPGRLALDDDTRARLSASLRQPLANDLDRGQALRFAALLHDIAKPQTRAVSDEGRVTFMEHDVRGAALAREILGRLRAADRLGNHVAMLTRDHLRLGFLVHRMPLARRDVYDYLHACAPLGVDVTMLSVADRLATRGDDAPRAIARHLELARLMIGDALRYEADPPRAPVRGDELAGALGRAPGPWIGPLLAQLTAARFAGEIDDRAGAIALARRLLDDDGGPAPASATPDR